MEKMSIGAGNGDQDAPILGVIAETPLFSKRKLMPVPAESGAAWQSFVPNTVTRSSTDTGQPSTARVAALEEECRNYRDLISRSSDGYIEVDPAGWIRAVNRSAAELLKTRAESIPGRSVSAIVAAGQRLEFERKLASLATSNGPVRWSTQLSTKNGSTVRVDMTAFVSVGSNGVKRILCLARRASDVESANGESVTAAADRVRRREAMAAEQRARSWIGQELHDSLGSRLTGLSMISESVHRLVREHAHGNKDLTAAATSAMRVRELAAEVIECAQRLAKGMFPIELESAGIAPALAALAGEIRKMFHIDCRVRCDRRVRIDEPKTAMHVYRIVQEAVTNAIKHGKSKRILIRLAMDSSGTALMIADDGKGMPASSNFKRGLGLRSMAKRAQAIGATFKIRSRRSGGTLVSCQGIGSSSRAREAIRDAR